MRRGGRGGAACGGPWRPRRRAPPALAPAGGPRGAAERLEWRFGGPDDAHGALALGGGAGAVTGRVDRVDVAPGGGAVVHDYKGRVVTAGARWADQGQLQVALYLLAVRELL